MENMMTKIRIVIGLWIMFKKLGKKTYVLKKRALAGVGNPIKEDVWRVSRLNLASRKAENTGMINEIYGMYFEKFPIISKSIV